jgi:predicted amidohydrolase
MRIALAQINPTVGDLRGNLELIASVAARARDAGAHLVVFPELALSGYPPEDLLLNPHFVRECRAALADAARRCAGIDAVVGFPEAAADRVHNAAALLRDGAEAGVARKTELPNYGVFDEHRHCPAGPPAIESADLRLDDLHIPSPGPWSAWPTAPPPARAEPGLAVHAGKLGERHAVAAGFARRGRWSATRTCRA